MLRARIALAVAVLAASAVAIVPSSTVSADPASAAGTGLLGGINIGGLGYNTSTAEADRSIAAAQRLHARLVRFELPWAVLEPNGPDQRNARALAFTDRVIADAKAAGIGVIAMVRSTPCWATSAPRAVRAGCAPGRGSPANAWPPQKASDLGTFMAFLSSRYGSALAALEVWNEPDQRNELYLAGRNKAQHYAEMLRASYTAIKQVDPSMTVLGGSIVGSNGAFLRALYAAGIKGYYDGLAVHFYTLTVAALRSIREVQLANGDSTPLWLDEFGWSSCWPARVQQEQPCVTPAVQAQNIANTIRMVARLPYVAAAVVFKLTDSPQEDFGVVSKAGRPKPSFAALASALASPGGPVSRVRLQLRRSNGSVVATGSAPVGEFMELEALRGGALRYRAVFVLDRFNRFSITLPSVLGVSGLQVAVFQYGQGSSHATRASL